MLHFEPIIPENAPAITALQVSPAQRTFVAPNSRSLEEAEACNRAGGFALPLGIYDGDIPVGFVMLGFGVDDDWENPPAIAHGNYNLWRLMIDQSHQGKGYGRQAMQLALDYIRTYPCGPAQYCWLSYEPENLVAKRLYESFGFAETGEMDENEIISLLKL